MIRHEHPVPQGFHTVTPQLVVRDARAAIRFYERAFGADELFRNTLEGSGLVLHARIAIGDSILLLSDEFPREGVVAPGAEPSPVTIHLYVEDVDAWYERAVRAGARVLFPLQDTFWGDRHAVLEDPDGHRWSMATRLVPHTDEEVLARTPATCSPPAPGGAAPVDAPGP